MERRCPKCKCQMRFIDYDSGILIFECMHCRHIIFDTTLCTVSQGTHIGPMPRIDENDESFTKILDEMGFSSDEIKALPSS